MKIFLTGGTGFIGTHLLRSPLAIGHQVVALKRQESKPCLPVINEPTWVTGSLDEVEASMLQGCDVLVHLASPGVSPKMATWDELFYWNVTSTLRLIEQARLASVNRVVVAGTFAEYGRSADNFDRIPYNAPLVPTYAYAASKAAASVALSAYAVEHRIQLAYLRIFSAFGEGQYKTNFWPALKAAALAGEDFPMTYGEQIRDYITVESVASLFWDYITKVKILEGEPLVRNIGTGEAVTMKAFAEKWWGIWNAPGRLKIGELPYRQNEVMRFVPEVINDD
jgi:nucleoside-diphosphate-sugar epimerase